MQPQMWGKFWHARVHTIVVSLTRAKMQKHGISGISETTTPINVKILDNVCIVKISSLVQYNDVTTNSRWWTAAMLSFLAVNHQPIVQFQLNFAQGSRVWCRHSLSQVAPNANFRTSRLSTAAILKNVIQPNLGEKSSDINVIWYRAADFEANDSHDQKWNF